MKGGTFKVNAMAKDRVVEVLVHSGKNVVSRVILSAEEARDLGGELHQAGWSVDPNRGAKAT